MPTVHDDIVSKITRANSHIKEVEQLARTVIEKKHPFGREYDEKTGEIIIRILDTLIIPCELSIICGEVIHH